MNSRPPGPMPGQKDDRIRKGELFDEQRKKEEEDGGVDFEAIFARIAKLEEMSARNSTDRMKLEKRTNYLGKVVEDLHMEAKEEENCVRMTSRTANFGSTDIRFKKKNMEAPKKTKKQENAGFCEACLELCFLAGLALPRPANQ